MSEWQERAWERAKRKQARFYPGDDEMLYILYAEELRIGAITITTTTKTAPSN